MCRPHPPRARGGPNQRGIERPSRRDFDPDDRDAAALQRLMGGGGEDGGAAVEFRAVWPDNGVRWLRFQGAARRVAGWRVAGGAPPARRGFGTRVFGTRVVEEAVRRQLGGEERWTSASEEVVCDIEVPAGRLAPARGAGGRRASDPPGAPPARLRRTIAPQPEIG